MNDLSSEYCTNCADLTAKGKIFKVLFLLLFYFISKPGVFCLELLDKSLIDISDKWSFLLLEQFVIEFVVGHIGPRGIG